MTCAAETIAWFLFGGEREDWRFQAPASQVQPAAVWWLFLTVDRMRYWAPMPLSHREWPCS